jgi:hypothetical protein
MGVPLRAKGQDLLMAGLEGVVEGLEVAEDLSVRWLVVPRVVWVGCEGVD